MGVTIIGTISIFFICFSYFDSFVYQLPSNNIGIITQFSSYKNFHNSGTILLSVFAEKSLVDRLFSAKIDIPTGIIRQEKTSFVLHDIALTIKFNPSDLYPSPIFSLTFILPSGNPPFTYRHIVMSPRFSLLQNIGKSNFHLSLGGYFSPQKIANNPAMPIRNNDIFALVGLNYAFLDYLIIDIKVKGIYEEFRLLVFQPQIYLSFVVKRKYDFLSSVFAFHSFGQTESVRSGYGIGLSFLLIWH